MERTWLSCITCADPLTRMDCSSAYFPKEKVMFQGGFSRVAPGQPANDNQGAGSDS